MQVSWNYTSPPPPENIRIIVTFHWLSLKTYIFLDPPLQETSVNNTKFFSISPKKKHISGQVYRQQLEPKQQTIKKRHKKCFSSTHRLFIAIFFNILAGFFVCKYNVKKRPSQKLKKYYLYTPTINVFFLPLALCIFKQGRSDE